MWSVLINNTTYGPYSMEEMRRYIAEGRIKPEMLAWQQGMQEWKRIGELPELLVLFQGMHNYEAKTINTVSYPSIIKKSNKKKRIVIGSFAFLAGILVLFGLLVSILGKTTSVKDGFDKKVAVIQEMGGVSVTLPDWVFPEGEKILIKKDANPPAFPNNDEVIFQAYDVELPKDSHMDGVAEIRLPFDKKLLKGVVSPDEAIGAAYYDTTANAWTPMPCTIDTDSGYIVIYTDHFSKFAAIILKDGKKKLGEVLPEFDGVPFEFYNQSEMNAIVNEGMSGASESTTAIEKGWNKFNELYGLTGAGSAVTEAAVGTETLKNVNKLMNEAGLGFALAQLAFDIYKGDNSAAVKNFTKSGTFYSISKWGGDALGLASAGVTFMDVALNKFGETALDKNLQKWESGYKKYYNTEPSAKRTAADWYKTIAKLKGESTSADELKTKLDAEVKAYCEKFWLDAEAYAYVAESTPGIRGFGAGGEVAAGKEQINANFTASLYEYKIKPALTLYMKKQWFDINKKAEADFRKLKSEMNKTYTVTIKLNNYSSVKNLSATSVRFINKKGEVVHGQSFDGNGQVVLKMSLLGFLKAGEPLKIQVKVPSQTGTEEFNTEITYKLDKNNINLNIPYIPAKEEPKPETKQDKPVVQEQPKKNDGNLVKPNEPNPEIKPEVKQSPAKVEDTFDYQAALSAWAADFATEVNSRTYDNGICKTTNQFEWVMKPVIRDGQVVGASKIWQTNSYYAGDLAGKTYRNVSNEAFSAANPGIYTSVGELRKKYPQFIGR